MARKLKAKPDDPEEYKRFIETSHELVADDPEALERALKKIGRDKREKDKPSKQ